MTDYTVTLIISDAAYTRAQRIAQTTDQPIELILSSRLENALDDLAELTEPDQTELTAFQHLSVDTLWTIAREQMPAREQERLSLLLALNKRAVLTPSEQDELDDLLERGDRLMLRKAEAAALLTQRGFQVKPVDMTAPRE